MLKISAYEISQYLKRQPVGSDGFVTVDIAMVTDNGRGTMKVTQKRAVSSEFAKELAGGMSDKLRTKTNDVKQHRVPCNHLLSFIVWYENIMAHTEDDTKLYENAKKYFYDYISTLETLADALKEERVKLASLKRALKKAEKAKNTPHDYSKDIADDISSKEEYIELIKNSKKSVPKIRQEFNRWCKIRLKEIKLTSK